MTTPTEERFTEQEPVVPTQEAVPDATTEVVAEPEPDWKAEAEQARAEALKAQNDLKAAQGRQRQRGEDQARWDRINAEISALRKANAAFTTAYAESTPEVLPAQMQQIEAESQQEIARIQAATTYDKQFVALQNSVLDDKNEPVFDLQNAPELAEIRVRWNSAESAGDLGTMTELVQEAARLATLKQIENKDKALQEAAARADLARREAFEESNVLETGSGSSSASGADPDINDLITECNRGPSRMKPEDRERVTNHLNSLSRRPGSLASG